MSLYKPQQNFAVFRNVLLSTKAIVGFTSCICYCCL